MKEWFVGFTVAALAIALVFGSLGGFFYLIVVVLPIWAGVPLGFAAILAACTVDECKALGRDILK